ncbi:unnamed protein product [Cylindrotheca closterium]|uniref:EGF-like domain-containing protein n=1 Tax=Cylindrotheca closterium TaxID=2856 RepID=A0AAD2GAR9_9STRA|nr:unnamed protein product [Cylindrotheca closterium]
MKKSHLSSIAKSILLVTMAASSTTASDDDQTHVNHDLCSDDDHCLNGGSCQEGNSVVPHRHCLCGPGFSGPTCERFCPLDCKNGSYCHEAPTGGASGLLIDEGRIYDPEDYSCKCFGHFTGALCEIPYKGCGDSERCYNGGECVAGDDMRHHCKCKKGYIGDSCETRTSIVIKEESNTALEAVLVSLVIFLTVALAYLLKRKRINKLTPDFVEVQRLALEHKMAEMPHASFDDQSTIHFENQLSGLKRTSVFDDVRKTLWGDQNNTSHKNPRAGPYDDESSASSGSSFGDVHII